MKRLLRPTEISKRIGSVEKELITLFLEIKEERNLEFENISLIPLMRRGKSLLPNIKRKTTVKSDLASILQKFGYFEEYAFFPSIRKIMEFDTVLIFDDICRHGEQLKEYESYLKDLSEDPAFLEHKDIIWVTYLAEREIVELTNKQLEKKKKIYTRITSSTKKDFTREVQRVFESITCRGEIIDPDHMFVEIKFKEKQNFLALWEGLEKVAQDEFCILIEDGIDFIHPERKKLGLFVKGTDKKRTLVENLGFSFPECVEKIEIAKLRMLFELELSEKDEKSVFTQNAVVVPIINPVIDEEKFWSMSCEHWESTYQFCKKWQSFRGKCNREFEWKVDYLKKYHNPRYDCIICSLVKNFSDYFYGKIKASFEGKPDEREIWVHRDREIEFLERNDKDD